MRSPLPIGTHLRQSSALVAVLLITSLFLCLSARATLLWQADTNRGTSVFEGLEEAPGTIVLTNDPLGKYGLVYCYSLWDSTNYAKERVESRGTKTPSGNFRMSYGSDYYIGWRAMWRPMPINPGWVALFQMHGYGVSGQGAPLVLRCVNGDGNLYMQNNANGVDTNFWHIPFKTNLWQNFVVHTLLSTNYSEGYTEIWVNGVQQTFNNGQTRWYGPTWDNVDGTWQDSYNLVKWGCYRSGAMNGKGPASAFMSNAKIGTTYADVDPSGGGTITIGDSPQTTVVAPGDTAVYTTTVTLDEFTGTVNLSAVGLPAGAAAAFNPPSLTASGSSTLTITTSASTPLGSSVFSIIGDGGTKAGTNTATLIVSSFTLSAVPASQSVLAGSTANFTLTATTNASFSGTIAWGIAGLPSAATADVTPPTLAQSGTSTLTVQTTTNTPGGFYSLTISATNGPVVLTTNVILSVSGIVAGQGTLLWTAASGTGTNWSTLQNWTNITSGGFGPPGPSNSVVFTNTGSAPTAAALDNAVDSKIAVLSLAYTHTNRFHNTLITSGNQLTIATNLSVGTATDLGTNAAMFASITGAGASLVVTNPNCLINIRQGTGSGTGPYAQRATLDLSGLDTFNVQANRILVAADGGTIARETGTFLLAKTNIMTLYGIAPAIDLGENSSNGAGANNDPSALTSYLFLGQVNAIFADSISIGRSKGAGWLGFNPAFTNGFEPTVSLRGTAGGRVTTLSTGDESPLGNSNQRSAGTVDFSGGTVDALIDTAYVGRSMNGTNTGTAVSAVGTLTFDDGTIDVNTLEVAYQTFAAGTGPGSVGTVNVNGNATLVANQLLELTHGSASIPAAQATLNLNGGTVQAANISGGGGLATIHLNTGTIDAQSGNIVAVTTLTVGTNGAADAALLMNAASLAASNTIVVALNGTISGNTILTDPGLVVNGQLAPGGDTIGAMTNNGPANFGAGGSLALTVQDALAGPAAGWSFLGINGSLNLQATAANPFTIFVQTGSGEAANFDFHTNYDWVIATASGGISGFDPAQFAVDNSQFANDLGGGYFYVRASGNSLILSFTNNHPPAAQTAWLYRTGNTMTIPLSSLATNWSDPDGDPVIFAGMDAGSAQGVNNLGTDGTNIYYTNFNNVADSFHYTVQDVRTNPPAVYQPGDTIQTAVGLVNILPPPMLTAPTVAGDSVEFSGNGGAPLRNYYVLGTTNIILPISAWSILATGAFDPNGAFSFTNSTPPGQPQSFYRLQLP